MSELSLPREIVMGLFKILGNEKDREMFLSIFQSVNPENFALLMIEPEVLRTKSDLLAWDLAFLSHLDLTPLIIVEIEKENDVKCRNYLIKKVKDYGGQINLFPLTRSDKQAEWMPYQKLQKCAKNGRLSLISVDNKIRDGITATKVALNLIREFYPRKILVLNNRGGLYLKNGRGLNYLEIDPDLELLYFQKSITVKTYQEIRKYREMLVKADEFGKKVHIQVTSPGDILKELFTVQGSGTYLNLSNELEIYNGYKGLDKDKIWSLIESGFNLRLKSKYAFSPQDKVIVDKDYKALAILKKVNGMLYLDKFVVKKRHQSEGWGNSIWREVLELNAKIFWRTKSSNPLKNWYFKKSDGHQIVDDWYVYWIGLNEKERKKALRYCKERDDSFLRETN